MTVKAAINETNRSTGQQFATVSIPDLRVQQIASVHGLNAATDSAKSPVPTYSKPGDIRQAIEKTIENNQKTSVKGSTTEGERDTRASNAFLSNIDSRDIEIQPIVDSVIEYYPAGGFSTIMLVGSESNPLLDITVAKTAAAIQRETEKKILLIDSDFDHGGLTYKLECVGKEGLADVANGKADWGRVCSHTSVETIDFVAVGKEKLDSADRLATVLKTSFHQLNRKYDYVIVCGGEAHGDAALAWGHHTDGTFLLVSLTNSHKTVAQSAVSELQSHGARLLGCIVSEAD